MKRFTYGLLMLALMFTITAAQNVLDKVVAVIDDEIILKSELDQEVSFFAAQRNLNPNSPELRKQVLDAKVEEKLLYAQAELDSITVSDDEVDNQIEMQLNYFVSQYGSAERIEEAYGMSIERIKREMRESTRKNLMAQTVRQQKFGMIDVTRREVEEFFTNYEDSLGVIPEKFKIAHIFINPKADEDIMAKARAKAQLLLDSIKAGADFAELAKANSDDPGSAVRGGDLGFVKRGVFFTEFESAAYALQEGELSGIVESPVGFHIIELLERRGESIHSRHILVKPKSDGDSDLRAIEFLSDVRDSILSGDTTFAYFAKKYSDDKDSKGKGGLLGVFEESQLEKPLLDMVYKLKEGGISFPKRLDIGPDTYGFHIVKLIERIPEHNPTLETDYDELKRLAEFQKREEKYNKWMTELKDKIYWEIRI
ncbi:MAG: peptidylprolyl isomerase [Melioribacteraceae bacterium]|nr:MAG: peptidylprolyl isomerase [Melioribacteraceae bacterium]